MSSGSPSRRTVIRLAISDSLPETSVSVMSVLMKPGATTLAVIPFAPSSLAIDFVESDQSRLGGGVVGLAGVAGDATDRPDVHDPAVAALHHGPGGGPAGREDRPQVDVDDRVEVLVRHPQQEPVPGDACVVHEDVEVTGGLRDLLDELAEGVPLADVAGAEFGRASGVRDLLDEGPERIGGPGHRHHVHAVGGKSGGDGAADPSAGTRDDG